MARILLVEDEPDLRDNIEVVLNHDGHTVVAAGNGAEALAALAEEPVDLVISDVSMPVMDGLTMVRRMRETMPASAETPVVLLTALGDRAHMLEGRSAGADEYLTKPVDYQMLAAVVNARLSRARQALDLKEKQFIRLFKQLNADVRSAEDLAAAARPSMKPADGKTGDVLERVRALAPPSLRDRATVMFLEDHVPDYQAMSPASRARAEALMRRVLAEATSASSDAAIELGAGAALLIFAGQSREIVADKLSLVRVHLDHLLGAENLVDSSAVGFGGRTDDDDADGDPRVDGETKGILRDLFADAGDGENAGRARRPDFSVVAGAFRFDYQPVWCVRNNRVEAYRLRWLRIAGAARLTDDETLLAGFDDPMAVDVACLALEAAFYELRALAAHPAGGAPPFIVMPASPAMLKSPKLMKKLNDPAFAAERRRIGFHLRGRAVADDAAAGKTPKSPSTGGVALIFHDFDAACDLAAWAGTGDSARTGAAGGPENGADAETTPRRAVHFDAAVAEKTPWPRDRMRAALIDDVRQAAGRGATVWVSNVDTSVTARLATSAGARFISGKAVGASRPKPDHSKKLSATQVLMTV